MFGNKNILILKAAHPELFGFSGSKDVAEEPPMPDAPSSLSHGECTFADQFEILQRHVIVNYVRYATWSYHGLRFKLHKLNVHRLFDGDTSW